VYSEKELIREIDKIASTLVPEKDWSIRIAAMQRIESLVLGGWYFSSSFQEYVVCTEFYSQNPILKTFSYFVFRRARTFVIIGI